MYQLDASGRVIPYNDPGLRDDDILIRRVTDYHLHPTDQGRRITKTALSPSSMERDPYRGMSCDSLDLLIELGIDPSDASSYHPSIPVLLGLRVGDVRNACPHLLIGRCPDPGPPPNPAHFSIWGLQSDGDKKKLLKLATPLRSPSDLVSK